MHERIFGMLLRLYPAQFRKTHGQEAILLFQDRLRDETGSLRRVRLWADLLADLGAIRLRGYYELSPETAVAASMCGPQGVPSFVSLEDGRLPARSFLRGGLLSVLICASALFALEHGRRRQLPPDIPSYAAPEIPKRRVHVDFTREPLASSKVRLKAVVTPLDGGPLPTGTITFDYGWRTLASGTLNDGAVVLDAKLPNDKGWSMNALYLGDANYLIARSKELRAQPREVH